MKRQNSEDSTKTEPEPTQADFCKIEHSTILELIILT